MTEPVLVYDDDCGFCTWWADWIAAQAPITTVGFTSLSSERSDRLPANFERCAHLITAKRVFSCGEAVEAALLRLPFVPSRFREPGPIRRSRPYRYFRERGYRWVAENRDSLSTIVAKKPRTDATDSVDST